MASAVTCTMDQRPAATLLVPWFQVTFNPDGSRQTTTGINGQPAFDTLVIIANASSAPTLAHVSVFSERSVLVLDFNVALTGFDVQPMSMSEILRGNLPATPISTAHVAVAEDVCQRNTSAAVYPAGYLRVRPLSPTAPEDNTLATALYPVPAFTQGGAFQLTTLDSLDTTADSLGCTGGTDRVISGVTHGYITIDMVNYCNLSNPSDPLYYANDAIGMENNLWGEVVFKSSSGIPIYGSSTVNIEADRSFSNLANGGQFDQTLTARTRTFYGRYWSPATESFCTNCTGAIPHNLALIAPWNQGFGDEREPLGLKYAARWFEESGVHTDFVVWRASATVAAGTYTATFLKDLTTSQTGTSGACSSVEPWPLPTTFYDEDENTVSVQAPLPSPLPPFELFNPFPRETQKISVGSFPRPAGAVAGWVSFEFRVLTSGQNGTVLDQAWMGQEITNIANPSSGVFWTGSSPSTPLDPSTCNPLGMPIGPFSGGVNGPIAPVIPVLRATGPLQ